MLGFPPGECITNAVVNRESKEMQTHIPEPNGSPEQAAGMSSIAYPEDSLR